MFNYATIICSFTPKEKKKTAISDDVLYLKVIIGTIQQNCFASRARKCKEVLHVPTS